MIRFSVAGAIVALAASASAQTVIVRGDGRQTVVDLRRLPTETLQVRDPTDGGKPKKLLGVELGKVLRQIPRPNDADAVAVRCDDGWLSLVPLRVLVRFPEALLATMEFQKDGKLAPLAAPRGPIFLAWPNVDHPEFAANPDLSENGFTFAVASIDFVKLSDFAPPGDAARASPTGRVLFQRHCQHCHALGGAGGIAGWDLLQPKIFSYRDERYLRAYLVDPRAKNPAGRMPSFKKKLAPADVDALVAFLRAL